MPGYDDGDVDVDDNVPGFDGGNDAGPGLPAAFSGGGRTGGRPPMPEERPRPYDGPEDLLVKVSEVLPAMVYGARVSVDHVSDHASLLVRADSQYGGEVLARISAKLGEVRRRGLTCFGSQAHGFRLNPPLDEARALDFERRHDVTLPPDYRAFLCRLGNGGAGPYYGLLPLERWAHASLEGLDDHLAHPCLLRPDLPQDERSAERLDADADADALQGTLALVSLGCRYGAVLVVNGPHAGRVVYVDESLYGPPYFAWAADFLAWYERWRDELLWGYDTGQFGIAPAGMKMGPVYWASMNGPRETLESGRSPVMPSMSAASELMALVYDQLRHIAEVRLAGKNEHTLQATALVHEVFLKLQGHPSTLTAERGRFFAVAAEAMRQILIDHARSRGCQKRGGALRRSMTEVADLAAEQDSGAILALDEAISRLEQVEPRAAKVVKLRFFAGLSVEETADAAGLSVRTVNREWKFARAWLYNALE